MTKKETKSKKISCAVKRWKKVLAMMFTSTLEVIVAFGASVAAAMAFSIST